MRLGKRVADLEARQDSARTPLDHLTDAELCVLAIQLIEQAQAQGVVLPTDWRDQYRRSPIRFSEWVDSEASRMLGV